MYQLIDDTYYACYCAGRLEAGKANEVGYCHNYTLFMMGTE
jgi:hypothetical protein